MQNEVYNSKRKIIIRCVNGVIIVTFTFFELIGIKYLSIVVLVSICVILLAYRHFKILINEEKIEFYSILKTKRTFYWKNIKSLDVEKFYIRHIIDYRINITVYTDNSQYTFDVKEFDNKKELFKDIINYCAYYGIYINDRVID